MRPKLAVLTSLVQDNIPAPLECCDKLFIGSIHAAFNVEMMKELGITHIVNASGLPPTYPKLFTYLTVEVRDKNYAPILGCIPAANIFIEAGLDEGGGVLVHCAGGRSRSAAIIAAFLMSTMKMTIDEAIAECHKARDLVNVNPGFQIQLHAYGAANCDVHSAHQILIHKRLERFGDKIQKRSLLEAESKEETELSKFEGKVEALLGLLDSASNATQPRLRLSRPASQAVQVIPPLRALERMLSCRRCATPLFSYANVVLLNTNHTSFDHKAWARDYVKKTSKGPQPFLTSPQVGAMDIDEGMNESHDQHRNGGGRGDGPPTFSGRNGGGFSRGKAASEAKHVETKREGTPPRPLTEGGTDISPSHSDSSSDALSPKMTDDDDDRAVPASPPILPALNFSCGNRYDIRRNSHTLQQQYQSIISPERPSVVSNFAEAKGISVNTRSSFNDGPPEQLSLSSMRSSSELEREEAENRQQNSARSVSSSNWSTPPDSGRRTTPRQNSNFRPQSAEKQRWLRRLQVLEHPSMVKVPVSGEGGGGDTKSIHLKLSDRVHQLADADEECQRALHSQVLHQPWRAIHQQYREAVEELSLPESPLRISSNARTSSQGGVGESVVTPSGFNADGSLIMGIQTPGNQGPKAFFLEPMEWMDLDTVLAGNTSEGCLTCPGCHCEVGSWMWDKPAVGSTSIPAPRFAVMRKFVLANPLPSENPSSRDSTPRNSMDSGSVGVDTARNSRSNSDPAPLESPNTSNEGGRSHWSPPGGGRKTSEPKDDMSPRLRKSDSKKASEDD